MAKYYIDYTCGHDGCREVQLGGPHKERERKLEWLRSECLCPDCYRAQKEAETKALGIVARVQAAPSAQPAIIISLHGDTKPCKEDIKARGYSWGDLLAGRNILFATLGGGREEKGWMRMLDVADDLDAVAAKLAAEVEWIKTLPNLNTDKSTWISPMDIEYLRGQIRRRAEQQAAESAAAEEAAKAEAAKAQAKADWLAANPRPACRGLREIVGAAKNSYWNGKWYGKNERRVYIDNVEYTLSAAEKEEWAAGKAELSAWAVAAKAAGVTL